MTQLLDPTRPPIPASGSLIAGLPKRQRDQVEKRARFFWDHFTAGMSRRRQHAVAWISTSSFLRGIHYFLIDSTGYYRPILPKKGEIRATTPVLLSRYEHALGFLNANEVGVYTAPITGSGVDSVYWAERGRAVLSHWIQEAHVMDEQDRLHQLLLTEGTAGLLRYRDPFRRQVFLRCLPGSELFPIPYDARTPEEMHGLIHAQIVSRQWLELQDAVFERAYPNVPFQRMADSAKIKTFPLKTDIPLGGFSGTSTTQEGSLLLTVYMKETEDMPGGEYMVIVGDDPARHMIGLNEQTGLPYTASVFSKTPQGWDIPVEITYFRKQPGDWWGMGLCEALIPEQISTNRRRTDIERNARNNKPWLFYDPTMVSVDDMQTESEGLVRFTSRMGLDTARGLRPAYAFPSVPEGREVLTSYQLARESADEAAGMRSSIIFGQQQGRTESGPATSILSQNAVASFNSVLRRLDQTWNRTLPAVLDMIKDVWPEQKRIRVIGQDNLGREMLLSREEVPASVSMIIRARPMLPGGKQTQLSLLFQLRQIPGPDGMAGTEVSSREFRQALLRLNALPDGVEAINYPETRIQTFINLLVNDGQTPAVPPSDPRNPSDRMVLENHKTAVSMLKDKILDPAFLTYGPRVKAALFQQLRFHMDRTLGNAEHPNSFDDELEKHDSRLVSDFLTAAEADLTSQEGEFMESPYG